MIVLAAPLAVFGVLVVLTWLAARAITRFDRAHVHAYDSLEKQAQTEPPGAIEPPGDLFPDAGTVARIGLILVHGVGEQTRFEHLESQLRDLITSLIPDRKKAAMPAERMKVEQVTVEIVGGGVTALHAPQDSWRSGPGASVTLAVRYMMNGIWHEARVFVHEVWWADVNERSSLAKQIRFWFWGLAMWAHPARMVSPLGSAGDTRPPRLPNHNLVAERLKLFGAAVIIATIGLSLGMILFFARRVFGLQTPRIVQTIANYISSVKLYNQNGRYGPSLSRRREDFLDTIGDRPRVSVRRRMIRTISDVACGGYHRWYVLAHSQGTVVTFNGLMETAYAWPGYLDERRWKRLLHRRMAGPAATGWSPPATDQIMPKRPAWATPDAVVYRDRVFRRCCGWLTYGSALEKFAALWPALVPISREPAFHSQVRWFNVYDPIDPVAGRVLAFQNHSPSCCPPAHELGYRAYPLLLAAHTHYLSPRGSAQDAASQAMRWMLTGQPMGFDGVESGLWYGWETSVRRNRRIAAYATGIGVWLLLLALGAVLLPWLGHVIVTLLIATRRSLCEVLTS